MGWVNRRRDLGGLDLYRPSGPGGNRPGGLQPGVRPGGPRKASALRNEYVIAVKGKVSARPKGTENPELKTGPGGNPGRGAKDSERIQPSPFSHR